MSDRGNKKAEEKPIDHNRKRSNTLSALKRKNLKLAGQMSDYIITAHLPHDQEAHMKKLRKELYRCANLTLYRDHGKPTGLKLIGSFFCGSKLCMICNQNRQKSTRRKYWKWFADNEQLFKIQSMDYLKTKVVTKDQAKEKFSSWNIIEKLNYDVMHLTLTVPHTAEHGFNGERFYFIKIQELYHKLRQMPYWSNLVYGGEYGIETTSNESGLHSHIHSLLLVKQTKQSRNLLHKFILEQWNLLTRNKYSEREQFSPIAIQKIILSNKLLDKDFVNKLDPKGATMVNLETIYSVDATGQKVRSIEWNSKKMLIAVMEAISYHFEPQAFDKQNGTFDFGLMAEIMPKIYRKQLYRKFGCLHGEACLNIDHISDDQIVDEYQEISQSVDQETGEVLSSTNFFICNPAHIYHVPEKDMEPVMSNNAKRQCVNIDALTTREALLHMAEIYKHECKQRKTIN